MSFGFDSVVPQKCQEVDVVRTLVSTSHRAIHPRRQADKRQKQFVKWVFEQKDIDCIIASGKAEMESSRLDGAKKPLKKPLKPPKK